MSLCSFRYYVLCKFVKLLQKVNYQEKEKEYDKKVLLGNPNLNTVEVLISNFLIDLYVSHDEFVSVNNALREYNAIKTSVKHTL